MITDNDKSLFFKAVKDVTPLKKSNIHTTHTHKNKTPQQVSAAIYHATHHTSTPIEPGIAQYVEGEAIIKYARGNFANTQAYANLKKGLINPEQTIDLHNYTLLEAQHTLTQFFAQSKLPYCIRIVHGKGLHSTNGHALLKSFVAEFLHNHPSVLAYHSCASKHGGTGAVLVITKS